MIILSPGIVQNLEAGSSALLCQQNEGYYGEQMVTSQQELPKIRIVITEPEKAKLFFESENKFTRIERPRDEIGKEPSEHVDTEIAQKFSKVLRKLDQRQNREALISEMLSLTKLANFESKFDNFEELDPDQRVGVVNEVIDSVVEYALSGFAGENKFVKRAKEFQSGTSDDRLREQVTEQSAQPFVGFTKIWGDLDDRKIGGDEKLSRAREFILAEKKEYVSKTVLRVVELVKGIEQPRPIPVNVSVDQAGKEQNPPDLVERLNQSLKNQRSKTTQLSEALIETLKRAAITRDFKDLDDCHELKCFINEIYRTKPFKKYLADRRIVKNFKLKDGLKLHKGDFITVSLTALLNQKSVFANPDYFQSYRFSSHRERLHPYQFIPFSSGPRRCPGRSFSDLIIKAALLVLVASLN